MLPFLISRENLTPDQLRAVEFTMDEHRLVVGGPGSGKTIVILHRARYLLAKYKVDPRKFQIIVFTKVLKKYIASSLKLLGLPEDCITTLDSWCVDFYKRNISARIPRTENKQPDFREIRSRTLKHLKHPATSPIFDFVLIDEGQDLTEDGYGILTRISRHLTVLIDHKQQVYDDGSNEEQIAKYLGLRKRSLSLLETFRCCPYIVSLASEFIADAAERDAYLNQNRIPQTEKETPVLYVASSFEDEMDQLSQIVQSRQSLGDSIAILVPQRRQAFGIAKGFEERNLKVEIPRNYGDEDSALDFTSDFPKIMPYPSAKGLTFDTVLLPRLVKMSFGGMGGPRMNRILFVAITRATKWVYMSCVGAAEMQFFRGVVQLADKGMLTIRRGETGPSLFDDPKRECPGQTQMDFGDNNAVTDFL